MTELIVAAEPAELVRRAAGWLALEVTRAIAERGRCALSLPGGRTPEPVYRELAAGSSVDWTRVDVFFGDERAVPPDHPDSNYRMVHAALLSRVPIPVAQVHRMEAERTDRESAAREYERLLPPRLDVLLLGMGADGHTASLFPGAAALDERQRRVVAVVGAKPPAERLTITPPVIEDARTGGRPRDRRGQGADGGPRDRGPAGAEGGAGAARAARGLVSGSRGRVAPDRPECDDMMVLAGDVGGTNARLAIVELNEGRARIVQQGRYPSRDYPALAPIVRRFLEEAGSRPERACLGSPVLW